MPAMRRFFGALLLIVFGCEPEPTPPPSPPPTPPRPIVNRAPLPAPIERIAFAREDGIWTVAAGGGDLQRIIPPTCPAASEPTGAPDRRWIAFTAALDPESNLYSRNLFVARPDGSELVQVTPMPRPTMPVADLPKGIVRGRAVLLNAGDRRALPRLRVTAFGLQRPETTDADGHFQTYLQIGGGWIKVSGEVDGRPVAGWRLAASSEGRITDLKDVIVSFGADDVPTSPAWTSDGKQVLYVMRHPSARTTLRRIRPDGSGDETVAAFQGTSILAGPVVRGESAWLKMSDGTVHRIDLKTKAAAETLQAGIAAPDALAVSADGAAVATLAMEPTGARSILLVQKSGPQAVATFKAGDPAPRALDFSPDGTRIVLDRHDAAGRSALWILTLATGELKPLVDPGSSPVWHGR